jgi:hypothetical protein
MRTKLSFVGCILLVILVQSITTYYVDGVPPSSLASTRPCYGCYFNCDTDPDCKADGDYPQVLLPSRLLSLVDCPFPPSKYINFLYLNIKIIEMSIIVNYNNYNNNVMLNIH